MDIGSDPSALEPDPTPMIRRRTADHRGSSFRDGPEHRDGLRSGAGEPCVRASPSLTRARSSLASSLRTSTN